MQSAELTTRIIGYENGTLEEEEVLDLFQFLVDTGLAWQFPGHYGRTAENLIDSGRINPPPGMED